MSIFQSYFDEIKSCLNYGNYSQLTKRTIDLTLDSKDIDHYKKMVDFLDWQDYNGDKIKDNEEILSYILNDLYSTLEKNPLTIEDKDASLLSVHNLIRSYKNSTFALGPVSFDLKKGDILGLVGENGNGKTTLLRTLCGELEPTSGEIHYFVPHKNSYDLRSHLVYIPQRTNSWQGSLQSNLQFTAASYGIRGKENYLLVQLVIARMGLRKYRNYKWSDLSSGYKMRFELARALLRRPNVLLIDEPLANLDILAQQVVLEDLRDIVKSPYRSLGIVLSSQQLYEVEKTSDNVIFLKDGLPRNLNHYTDENFTEIPKFIVEFESGWAYEQLRKAFEPLKIEKLQLNGGTYIAVFPDKVNQSFFLKIILDKQVPIIYFRNISNSTRRFFLS